jgi:hypothetical protein
MVPFGFPARAGHLPVMARAHIRYLSLAAQQRL